MEKKVYSYYYIFPPPPLALAGLNLQNIHPGKKIKLLFLRIFIFTT